MPHAGFLQIDVLLGGIDPNLAQVRAGLQSLCGGWPERDGPPLLVLPELFAGGFAYDRLSEMAVRTPWILDEMQQLSHEFGVILAGSLPEVLFSDGGQDRYFNTLYLVGSAGVLGSYRKQHLFPPMEEDRWFSCEPCPPAPVFTPVGVVGGLICFDLRFPDLARLQANQGAEILVVPGQWPRARVAHWRGLLIARAIENQLFVIGCNRSGTSKNTTFAGNSMVIAPDGTVLAEAGDAPEVGLARLDKNAISSLRAQFSIAGNSTFRALHREKIMNAEQAEKQIAARRGAGQRIVFTNGCFDILHPGHVAYLEAARCHGDFLVVGLNSDRSVRAIKGPERPVNPEGDRARVLAGLGCVDCVVIFDDDTPAGLIKHLLPDVLAKGADWKEEEIVGADTVKKTGGLVVRIPLVPDVSTTGIVKKIRS